jgi:hypothetical protein
MSDGPKSHGRHGDYFDPERDGFRPVDPDTGTSATHGAQPDLRPEEPSGEVPDAGIESVSEDD